VSVLSFISHLDDSLIAWGREVGWRVYPILAAIIFSETGLVIAPVLPGDTLLFAAGAAVATLAGDGDLTLSGLWLTLTLAAFLGNQVNFSVGRWLGPKLFHRPQSRWLNPRHLAETHAFFERHGGKTLILSRFLPVFRTYAPFVAGVGDMAHTRFAIFNGVGALAWVSSLLLAGYYFGQAPFIKGHLTLIILTITALSLLPVVVGAVRSHFKKS
jgi:membrane-associated protein